MRVTYEPITRQVGIGKRRRDGISRAGYRIEIKNLRRRTEGAAPNYAVIGLRSRRILADVDLSG